MPASEYTEQDRANEGCCWDYVRQLCPGGGCVCDCHATTEQILLSSRASLRRHNGELEADNGRLMGEISRQAARIAALEAEQRAARLVEAVIGLSRWDDGTPCFCSLCPETPDDHEPACLSVRAALAGSHEQATPISDSSESSRLSE